MSIPYGDGAMVPYRALGCEFHNDILCCSYFSAVKETNKGTTHRAIKRFIYFTSTFFDGEKFRGYFVPLNLCGIQVMSSAFGDQRQVVKRFVYLRNIQTGTKNRYELETGEENLMMWIIIIKNSHHILRISFAKLHIVRRRKILLSS